jgi:hypothetical protein
MVLQKSLIAALTLSLSACSTTFWYTPEPHQVAYRDLNYFKWDCAHAPEQMGFLQQQLAMTSPFPVDAPRRAIIFKNMNEMRMACSVQLAKPMGCTHVHEDMARGSSQAVVCHNAKGLGPFEHPVVNHWDPLID